MKKTFAVFAVFCAVAFSAGCAGNPPVHTYWLENKATGTFTAHHTYTALSPDEIAELGFVEKLPAGAKVID